MRSTTKSGTGGRPPRCAEMKDSEQPVALGAAPPTYYKSTTSENYQLQAKSATKVLPRELLVLGDPRLLIFAVFSSFAVLLFASCWYFSYRLHIGSTFRSLRRVFQHRTFMLLFYITLGTRCTWATTSFSYEGSRGPRAPPRETGSKKSSDEVQTLKQG